MKISALNLAASGLIACAQTAPAGAADREQNLAPILVQERDERKAYRLSASNSATRTEMPLQELPQSVQVISRQLIDDIHASRVDDVLPYVSGVARQNNFGGLWDNYAIRGFAGDENGGWNMLWNGFASNRGYSSPRDMANVERVDFMKGPAAALYGSSEPGGSINIVTKKPSFAAKNSVDLSAGTHDAYRSAIDSTGALSPTVAYRLNAAVERKGSMRDKVRSRREFFAPALTWLVGTHTVIDYEAEVLRHRVPLDRGILAVRGRLDALPASRFLGEPGDGNINMVNQNHLLTLTHQFNEQWHLRAGVFHKEGAMDGYATEAISLQADNATAWRRRRYRDYSWDDTSLQAEVGGKFEALGVQHEILTGIEADRMTLDQRQLSTRAGAATPYPINIYRPVYGQPLPMPVPASNTVQRQSGAGLFVQDQVSVSERWKLLAGVRFDTFHSSLDNRRTGANQRQDQRASSPRLGVTYLLSPSLSLYASAARSFRPNEGSDVAGRAFGPQAARAVEAGMKYESSDKSRGATLAMFNIVKRNVLTADPGNPSFSIAAGEARSRGVEFDVNGNVGRHWRLTGSFAYVDAIVARDNNLPAGTRLVNVPKLSGSALAVYEDTDARGGVYGAGGGLNYVGARNGDAFGSFELPAYVVAQALAYWQLAPGMRLSLNIDNLFNRRYYASSYSNVWIAPGTQRAATLGLNVKF